MTYLLDTDHISILQRATGDDFARLQIRLAHQPPTALAVSVISLHEQVVGCHTYINQARTADALIRGYAMLETVWHTLRRATILPFDAAAAAVATRLVAQRVQVRTMDLRIAAITLARDLVLLTRNARDFRRVPALQIEDWTV